MTDEPDYTCRWCSAPWPDGVDHRCDQLDAARGYQEQQLRDWVEGRPHCRESFDCCPDFSCCSGGGMAPREDREAFVAAGEEERFPMLLTFLGRVVARERPDGGVHIAGRE